jgi:hypothetical protein
MPRSGEVFGLHGTLPNLKDCVLMTSGPATEGLPVAMEPNTIKSFILEGKFQVFKIGPAYVSVPDSGFGTEGKTMSSENCFPRGSQAPC